MTNITNLVIIGFDIAFTCLSMVRDASKYTPTFFNDNATETVYYLPESVIPHLSQPNVLG